MSGPGTAAAIAARIAAGTADPAWFADMSCEMVRDVVVTTPTAAMAANQTIRDAILAAVETCQGQEGFTFGPGLLDRLALSGLADIVAAPFEGDLPGTIGKIALTLLLVGAGFAMILTGLRHLASTISAPNPNPTE
jgi:hypothetical protein